MPKILRPHLDQEQRLSQAYVKQKFETGQWGRHINIDKQRPHNELTRAPGKSYLLASVDAQELFDKYAGTGVMRESRLGHYTNQELIHADQYIGYAYSGSQLYLTKEFKIHHSKNRTHIVPFYNPEYVK
ncbi:MAG: hypothetical protein LBC43_02905 [Bifidobacteriaceae bacterium]|jgi:hypothetical protein|nr:hypothetical protein [Bifidobacteriaceae bacterium]